MLRNQFN